MKYITHKPAQRDIKIWIAIVVLFVLPFFTVNYFENNERTLLLLIMLFLGLFIFHFIIRTSLTFRPYFTSKLNFLSSKHKAVARFDVPCDLMFKKIIEVLEESKFRLREVDSTKNELVATTGISFKSWGENVYIQLEPQGKETVLHFTSASLFQFYTWGKNESNHEELFQKIEESFTI